jgi:RNA polymerase sigma-70 factor (ECF subfamily)
LAKNAPGTPGARPASNEQEAMPEALNTTIPSEPAALEALMRRHNGRLFRVARAILKDDAAAEDALQDAYVQAFRRSDQFRGDAELATWLTRIVINQALMMLRKRKREPVVVPFRGPGAVDREGRSDDMVNELPDEKAESPSDSMLRGEIRRVIERRIDQLPVAFRTVFVMREVEEMTVQETAECLGIPAATVRTRLFRARALLRESLERDMDTARAGVYGFAGARCDRIVAAVLRRLEQDRRE